MDSFCPACSGPAARRCRCPKANSACHMGHTWHHCPQHGTPVVGEARCGTSTDCICPPETPLPGYHPFTDD